VCRSKKEDWLPKKDRNQRRPGRRRSQEDSVDLGELHTRARVPPTAPAFLNFCVSNPRSLAAPLAS